MDNWFYSYVPAYGDNHYKTHYEYQKLPTFLVYRSDLTGNNPFNAEAIRKVKSLL